MLADMPVSYSLTCSRQTPAMRPGFADGPLIFFIASRSCLDLLNDSVSDLPDEDKERLVEWLHENSTKRKRSPKWKRTSVF